MPGHYYLAYVQPFYDGIQAAYVVFVRVGAYKIVYFRHALFFYIF